MKTGQKWLKTSKELIAWKIWTDGQIEVKNVKLNKVRNSNKALSPIKNSIKHTFIKEMLPRICTKMEHPLYIEFMSGDGLC